MRRTTIRMTLAAAVVALSACAFAQNFSGTPKSPAPNELPGKQLIVWTETQKPHPLPVISPTMYEASSYQAPAHTQILTGTILAQGPDLLLASSNRANYRINNDNDNQEQLRAFTGKKVRVSGNVDASARSIQVVSIEQR
jgi:hypothetical protein